MTIRVPAPLARSLAGLMAAVGLMLCAAGQQAAAATDTFDFGMLGASLTAPSSASACSSKCVIAGAQEQFFTKDGVTVGAIGYSASKAIAYVTQKPGAFAANGGETGIGESDTYSTPSDATYEITSTTWLLIDNTRALNAGYLSSSISIESIQSGEGANVYGYTGLLTSLDTSKLTLLATVSNPTTGTSPTQTVAVPNDSGYLVVQATGPTHGTNVVVGEMVLNTQRVPEPASLAVLGLGIAGLGTIRRRRRVAGARGT